MRYTWMDDYLLQKRAVTKDLQKDWNWVRYKVGGKMFAAQCLGENGEPYYINLKCDPAEGEFWRAQYPDIVPGFYSNKQTWISVKPDGEVPDDLLKDLLDRAWRLILQGFSKKRQREILGFSCCGTECSACSFYGNMCQGCNETGGKVFHAPAGKACPIYQCSVGKCRYATCASCDKLPCSVWQATRDPGMTDAQFEASIAERAEHLRCLHEASAGTAFRG